MSPDRVLLVDDEVDFVETLAERMRARGLEVETATSGLEAVERVRERTFDAIVLDLAMPGMDGLETLAELREIRPTAQVMVLSGKATVSKAVEATRLGAIDVLEKPAELDELLERIRAARAARIQAEDQRSLAEIEDILATKGW